MQRQIILAAIILTKFLIHLLLISPEYDLHRDEYLHIDQGNHLAFGYLSVPPMTAWIAWLINLGGNSIFLIKFVPALFGALTIVVVWKAIEALGGDLFAALLGSLAICFSVLFRLNILFQPNSLDVLCWAATGFFLIKYINDKRSKWLYWLAIVFAIGFLNKYNIVFLILGLLPAILLSEERRLLRSKHFYFAAGLAFLLILPNLLWQMENHFPVIWHLRELSETQLVNVSRWNFIRSQFLFFPGTFLIVILGLFALARDQQLAKYRFFLWAFIFTIAIFLLLKAKDYYAIGLYPIYFAFGSVYVSKLLKNRLGRVLRPVLLILIVGIFVPVFLFLFPNRSPENILKNSQHYSQLGLLTWEDGKEHSLPQDFADMQGWKELARKVDSVYLLMPQPEQTLVLCDNYGQAGAINFYTRSGLRAVSFNADYIHWFDLSTRYQHLIRIKNRWERETEMLETSPHFDSALIADSITNPYSREHGTVIFAFAGAKVDINKRIADELVKQSE